jgi:hypothetical protein
MKRSRRNKSYIGMCRRLKANERANSGVMQLMLKCDIASWKDRIMHVQRVQSFGYNAVYIVCRDPIVLEEHITSMLGVPV